MKTMLRVLALLMAALLCLGMTACGGNPDETSDPAAKVTTTAPADESADAPTESETPDTTTEATTTTTRYTKNIQGGIGYEAEVTTTTAAPKNPIRVLAIGHSFAVDVMRAHLWDLLKGAGYDYVVIGYLFTRSCSLNEQWDRMQGDADHEQYCKTDGYTGQWNYHTPPSSSPYNKVQYAIRDEKWDVITIQPDPDYGGGPEIWPNTPNDYQNVGNIVKWIKEKHTNPNAKLYYHMTWAFAKDCKLWCFRETTPETQDPNPYQGDQMKHYQAFVDATKKYVLDPYGSKFAGVIPAGTAVQNARTSRLGDTFNEPGGWKIENQKEADGYHLNDKGDYLAALTWYAVITGKSAKTATYYGKGDAYKADFAILAEAVDNALAKWDGVTESSYK